MTNLERIKQAQSKDEIISILDDFLAYAVISSEETLSDMIRAFLDTTINNMLAAILVAKKREQEQSNDI